MTAIDFTPVLQPLVDIAGLVLAGCASLIGVRVLQLLHLQNDKTATAIVNAAAQEGAGLAYATLAAAAHRPASIEIRSAAMAGAVQHVLATAPAAIQRSGLTEQLVADKVTAEFGKLIARDPTVSPGPSATAS